MATKQVIQNLKKVFNFYMPRSREELKELYGWLRELPYKQCTLGEYLGYGAYKKDSHGTVKWEWSTLDIPFCRAARGTERTVTAGASICLTAMFALSAATPPVQTAIMASLFGIALGKLTGIISGAAMELALDTADNIGRLRERRHTAKMQKRFHVQ